MRLRTSFLAIATASAVLLGVGTALPASADAGPVVSDDFSSGNVDTALWTVTDPSQLASVSVAADSSQGSLLSIELPSGTNFDAWNANRSVRLTQPIANSDFDVTLRWTSVPSEKYQTQGLLIQQDSQNWMRFDVHSTGSALRVFAARTAAGISTTLLQQYVATGPEVDLRVVRTGDNWALSYSSDGVQWKDIGNVSSDMSVNEAGPFAANGGPLPAWTSTLDYFFNSADPVTPEDGTATQAYELTTSVVGQGVIKRDPDLTSYPAGTSVGLTATPDDGWLFVGWQGDVSGSTPTTSVTMDASHSVSAVFEQSSTSTPLRFVLTTDVAGQGSIERFPDAADYADGTTVQLVAHAATGWSFAGWSGDASGSGATTYITMDADRSVSATFVEVVEPQPSPETGAFISDDFSSGQLSTDVWTIVDPVGDGTVSNVGVGTSNPQLSLSLPAGTAHDAYNKNNALRVMQPVTDTDFQVAARYTSSPSLKYQMQGILVEEDANDWLRFDVHSTGSSWRIYAAKTVDGSTSRLLQSTIPMSDGVALRVTRVGDAWTVEYSSDGHTWVECGTVSSALRAARIGPFVGNSGSNPAFQAQLDWFFDTSHPIVPEDGQVVTGYSLSTDVVGQGTVATSPTASSYPADTAVQIVAEPAADWEFSHWSGAITGTNPVASVLMDADKSITATFVQVTQPPEGAPVIDLWYGADQTFGANGQPQRWANVLGNVSDADGLKSLSYTLNGGPSTPLRWGPDLRRLYMPGDFNVQLDFNELEDGPNSLVITAVDLQDEQALRTVTVRKSVQTPSLQRTVDWSQASSPSDVAQVVDGKWSTGSQGLTVNEMGYDRTVAIGDLSWADYEVTVPVTVRGLGPGAGTPQSGVPLVGLGIHWNGHTPRSTEEPAISWWPTGAFAWFEWYGSGRFALQGNEGSPLIRKGAAWNFGTTYMMKVRAERESSGVRYSYRWWPKGAPEPSAWGLSLLEDAGPAAGSVLLIAHHVDASFGAVEVTPLP